MLFFLFNYGSARVGQRVHAVTVVNANNFEGEARMSAVVVVDRAEGEGIDCYGIFKRLTHFGNGFSPAGNFNHSMNHVGVDVARLQN